MDDTTKCDLCKENPAVLIHIVRNEAQEYVTLIDLTLIFEEANADVYDDETHVCRACAESYLGSHFIDDKVEDIIALADEMVGGGEVNNVKS